MGSCATLWAFEPAVFEELLARPAPGGADEDGLRAAADDVPLEALAAATWQDLADNDLSRIAQGEAFDRLPAERAAEVFERPEIASRHTGQLYPGFVLDDAERAALEALGGLLGLEPRTPDEVPWWVRARWSEPGDGFWVGVLGPDEVRALRDALRSTRLLDKLTAWDTAANPKTYRPETYAGLAAFLDQAADVGCGVIGVEGQS